MRLTRLQRTVLLAIARSRNGLAAITIYRRYPVPLALLLTAIGKLTSNELVSFDGERVAITEDGRQWFKDNRGHIAENDSYSWREVPEKYRAAQIAPFAPYAPRITELPRELRFQLGLVKNHDSMSGNGEES